MSGYSRRQSLGLAGGAAIAAALANLRGEDVAYVRAAAAMGLGEIDLDRVEIRRLRA